MTGADEQGLDEHGLDENSPRPLTPGERAVRDGLVAEAERRSWSKGVRQAFVTDGALRRLGHGPAVEPGDDSDDDSELGPRVPVALGVKVLLDAASAAGDPTTLRAAERRWRPATSASTRQVLRVLARRARDLVRRTGR